MTETRQGASLVVTTTLRARPGEEKALSERLRAFAATVVREEPGCLLFVPLRSRHEPTRFVVLERYRDEQALTDHANAPHFQDALPDLMRCLTVPPELVIYEELEPA